MSEFISVHLGASEGERRKRVLEQIAADAGAVGQRGPSISILNQMIADGRLEVRRTEVINEYGIELDYEAAVELMDDQLREALHMELAPCTAQKFFDTYVKAHREKFNEEWELAKPNPVW